jgi:solute carrier family 25 carnitine/acylcarnitine transporter 20/29
MRFGTSLPIALLALAIPSLATPSQTSWKAPSTSSRTLVDALNDDPDYSSLLHLLQRTRLIPTLNKLNGSTLFAPTNEAIAKHASKHSLWQSVLEDSSDLVPDNIQEQLRQQLFYHLLNESISAIPSEPTVSEYKTLLYPRKSLSPPSKDPPPYPPWMPIPGGTLGGEPQRIRLATHDNSVSIGADYNGKAGASIVKGLQDAGNGMLLGIGEVLEPPPDLGKL